MVLVLLVLVLLVLVLGSGLGLGLGSGVGVRARFGNGVRARVRVRVRDRGRVKLHQGAAPRRRLRRLERRNLDPSRERRAPCALPSARAELPPRAPRHTADAPDWFG